MKTTTTTTTTDKIQVGDSTTGTSTSTTYKTKPPTEYGWVCPRCSRVNAPWKSQCDCAWNYWYPIWDYKEPWWKQVTCCPDSSGIKNPCCDSDTFKIHPETITWKAPSSVCTSDSSTYKVNGTTTAWSANSAIETGGSDYQNSVTRNWENVPHTLTNMQKELDEIKSTLRGE